MRKLKREEMEKIRKDIRKEFPGDPALQQIHMARKILAREAELKGLSFVEHIKSQVKGIRKVRQGV